MESPFSPVPSRGFDFLAALALKGVRWAWWQNVMESLAHLASHVCVLGQSRVCREEDQCMRSPCVAGTLCAGTGQSLLGSWATDHTAFLSSSL